MITLEHSNHVRPVCTECGWAGEFRRHLVDADRDAVRHRVFEHGDPQPTCDWCGDPLWTTSALCSPCAQVYEDKQRGRG